MSSHTLTNIRIVLIETSHPGNIGATARAMKNMGLNRLYLVRPKVFPHADASARASGADDILAKTTVCDALEDAIEGCVLVAGTSARFRSIPWPVLNARDSAAKCTEGAARGDVAVLFGREKSGLSNVELDLCHFLTHIPCDPDFSSLNLAAAVQVMCYELLVAAGEAPPPHEFDERDDQPAEVADIERFYAHLEEVLIALEFLDPGNPRHLMRRLRRLFNRTRLTGREVNILRGILTSCQKHRKTD